MRTDIKDSEKTRLLDTAIDTENAIQTNTKADTEEIRTIDKSYLENRIIESIHELESIRNWDIEKINQIQWNSVLEYVYNSVLKPYRIDYRNIELLLVLCKIYLSINRIYSKSSSMYGYCIMINAPYSTIMSNSNKSYNIYIDTTENIIIDNDIINFYRVNHSNNTIVSISNDIYRSLRKMIDSDRQHGLTDKAENGSVMSLALGKIEYGWIEGKDKQLQAQILEQKYALPSDLLDKYSDN